MFKVRNLLLLSMLAATSTLFSGCGQSSANGSQNTTKNASAPTQSTSPSTAHSIATGAKPYQGKVNLAKFEAAAKANPKIAQAQIQAGVAARVNGDYQVAISFYKTAIADNPTNGVAYNNLGNVYFRDLSQPKQALPYYQKATQIAPTYGYGWWNLALCYQQLKQTANAKQAVQTGLSKVSKSDPAYAGLAGMKKTLK